MDIPFDYDSPASISAFLANQGWGMQKKFGQNFLISPGIREKIIALLAPQPDDQVWEIGPGLGAMTHMIIKQCASLTVFEIDRGFIDFLRQHFGGERFSIVEGDVLRTWPRRREESDTPDLIFGNLPYNCAASFIGDLVEHSVFPRAMVFTVQREVAQRMAAEPGSKLYGSFSLLCSLSWEVSIAGHIKPGAFYPAPEVTSSIVTMSPRPSLPPEAMAVAAGLIRELFSSRRKTVRNCVSKGPLAQRIGREPLLEALAEGGIDPGSRGEQVDAEQLKKVVIYLTQEFGYNILS